MNLYDEYINIKSHAALLERNKKVYRIIIDKQAAEINRLRHALERLVTDCMESDFNEHWDTFKNAEAVLAGKEGV